MSTTDHTAAQVPEEGGQPGVRLFRGRTVNELIPKIEAELGADALIVRRRDGLRGGFMGFFQQTYVEIEATRGTPAVDLYDDYDYAGPDGMDLSEEMELSDEEFDALAAPAGVPLPAASSQAVPAPAAPAPAPVATAAPARGQAPAFHPDPLPVTVAAHAPAPMPAPPATAAAALAPAAAASTPAFLPPYDPYGLRSRANNGTAAPAPASAPAYAPAPAHAQAADHAPAAARASAPATGLAPSTAAAAARTAATAPPSAPARTVGGRGAYLMPELAELASGHSPVAPAPARPTQPREAPTARASVDFQELLGPKGGRPTGRSLAPGELLIAPAPQPRLAAEPPASAPSRPYERERRTVVAGSEGRAHAGVLRSLLRVGVSEEFACELLEAADAHTLPLSPEAGLAEAVRSTLVQRIPQALPLPCSGAAVAVLGAGGSGKTTFCAALLAAYRSGSSLDASYATIMRAGPGEPLQMVLSPEVIAPVRAGSQPALRAVHKVRSEGLAILDTPSLSPSDRRAISELADVLVELRPDRVVVAMSATVGAAAAEQMLSALEPLHPDALAITHADETDQLGVAVEAACRHGLAPELVLAQGGGRGWQLHRCDPHELAARVLP